MPSNDIGKNALGILAQVAPTIAGLIGGPFAAMGVSAIEKAFGLEATGDQTKALAAVANATPEQLLALKAEDNRHAEAVAKLGLDASALAFQDRDSARKMQIETKDWTPRLIAIIVFFGFFATLAWMAAGKMQIGAAGQEAFTIMIGSLGTILTQIVAYYFGSSAGSAKKDDTIKAMAA